MSAAGGSPGGGGNSEGATVGGRFLATRCPYDLTVVQKWDWGEGGETRGGVGEGFGSITARLRAVINNFTTTNASPVL